MTSTNTYSGPGTVPPTAPRMPPAPKGRSPVPILLALGVAAGAGYYLMNPSKAQHDADVIKEKSQTYGNKFDNAVDNAMDKAKEYGKEAKQDIRNTYEEVKAKASNAATEVQGEAEKLKTDVKAEANKKKGWFS